ncbi:MAG: hypothetical protein K2W95_27135 [Candidatus Obscuribacterales bacterium]|nr:hypothetical protein [Candidatus Obscuribacterales bacterium]
MAPFNATPPNKKSGKQLPQESGLIDASPGGPNDRPSNITETKVWQSSKKGVGRFLFNYKKLLHDSFVKMDRQEQEALIEKFSMVITMGVCVLMLLAFSGVLPREARVLGFPVAIAVSWWVGTRVVAGVVIERMDSIMKKE